MNGFKRVIFVIAVFVAAMVKSATDDQKYVVFCRDYSYFKKPNPPTENDRYLAAGKSNSQGLTAVVSAKTQQSATKFTIERDPLNTTHFALRVFDKRQDVEAEPRYFALLQPEKDSPKRGGLDLAIIKSPETFQVPGWRKALWKDWLDDGPEQQYSTSLVGKRLLVSDLVFDSFRPIEEWQATPLGGNGPTSLETIDSGAVQLYYFTVGPTGGVLAYTYPKTDCTLVTV